MTNKPLIVLTTDFSAEAERAYEPAVELAERLGGRIDLIHVVEEVLAIPHGAAFAPPLAWNADELVEAARKQMDEAVRRLNERVPTEGHVLRAERAARAVCVHAEERDAAYLVVATHGRTGLRRMVLGSTAEQILRHAVTPLLILPPAK